MKKTVLLILVSALLICCLAGCADSDNASDSDANDETFSYSELNIELPEEFKSSSASSGTLASSDEHEVKVVRVELSKITPKEGYEFPTIETFFSLSGYIDNMDETDVKEEDGLKIAEFDLDGDGKNDILYVLKETDKAYWAISFSANTDDEKDKEDKKEAIDYDYDASRPSYLEWAKTITFSPVEN